MPQMNGVEFLEQVRDAQPDAVRLMLSASADFDTIMNAINRAEVFRYISKPWTATELEEIVRLSLARRDKAMEDRHLADEVRCATWCVDATGAGSTAARGGGTGHHESKLGTDGSVMLD